MPEPEIIPSAMNNLSIKRALLGITIGILLSVVLAILFVNMLPFYIAEYLPICIGAFVASCIVKDRPLIAGLIVACIMIFISFASFLFVIYSIEGSLTKAFKAVNTSGAALKITIQLLIYIPCGLVGSYCGWDLRKKIGRNRTK